MNEYNTLYNDNPVLDVTNPCRIYIGYAGEHNVKTITFDFTKWISRFGAGTLKIRMIRPGDGLPYYVERMSISSPGMAVWTITETDTAKRGSGELQVQYDLTDGRKKSAIFPVHIFRSLQADTIPDPYGDIVDTIVDLASATEQNATEAAGSAAAAAQSAVDASGSAGAALISANNAARSEQGAADSAREAAASERNAGASESNAAASERNAGASELAAGRSEQNASNSASAANNRALDSEAWAIGKRGGEDVDQSDPTHNNNSKWYAEMAGQHAHDSGYIFVEIEDGDLYITYVNTDAVEFTLEEGDLYVTYG